MQDYLDITEANIIKSECFIYNCLCLNMYLCDHLTSK
jgi:hypothetical protein